MHTLNYYELNSVWTGHDIVLMVLGPRPPEEERSLKTSWEHKRTLIRKVLVGAIEAGKLVPINKDRVEEELKKIGVEYTCR